MLEPICSLHLGGALRGGRSPDPVSSLPPPASRPTAGAIFSLLTGAGQAAVPAIAQVSTVGPWPETEKPRSAAGAALLRVGPRGANGSCARGERLRGSTSPLREGVCWGGGVPVSKSSQCKQQQETQGAGQETGQAVPGSSGQASGGQAV